ncbi:MAG: uracil-DNA glycosylase family protein [Rickettsiaceae bacterium]
MNKNQQSLYNLNWLHSIGIKYYCSTKKDSKICTNTATITHDSVPRVIKSKEANPKSQQKVMKSQSHNAAETARHSADQANNLTELRYAVENFTECELKQFANSTVFADGQVDAKILLIGEAPGVTEDEQGIPFCGTSGKLLDEMLNTIDISRKKNAYITNTIFWRPPANRRPTIEEINICKPFVEKHIALIKPNLIILVGNTATTSLLGTTEKISNIRQNNYFYTNKYLNQDILTTAIFHPAYLLRQPMQKKATWFDLLRIQAMLQQF